MSYVLSALDKSPLIGQDSPTDALKRTIAMAQLAERLGYHRFWVAEHHNVPDLASSSPEILISHLLAHTNRIRIGSGGVMLQHYSPYKVAENFNLLASLAPGRVDLGVGKAPGGLPLSTRALQADRDPARKPDFAQQIAELGAYLDRKGPVDGLAATPLPTVAPQRFLLGASVESAELAAAQGWEFVFARHLNGDDALLDAVALTYRSIAGKAPIVAVSAIVSEYAGEALAEAENTKLFKVHVPGAQSVTVGSAEQAEEYARQVGAAEYRIEPKQSSVIAGTPDQVGSELDRLADRYGIAEFIVEPAVNGSWRLATLELLARRRSAVAA